LDHAAEYEQYFEPEYRVWRLREFNEFEEHWRRHRDFPNEYRDDLLILFDDRGIPLPISLDLHGFTREPAAECTETFLCLAERHRLPVVRIIHGLGDVLSEVVEDVASQAFDEWRRAPQVARGSVTLQSAAPPPSGLWPDYETWHRTALASVPLRRHRPRRGAAVNGATCLVCSGRVIGAADGEGKCALCGTRHFADGPLLKVDTRSVTCAACSRVLVVPEAPFPVEVRCPCGFEAAGADPRPVADAFCCSCPACGARRKLALKEQRLLLCTCGCLYLSLPIAAPTPAPVTVDLPRCGACGRPVQVVPPSDWPTGFEVLCHCGAVVNILRKEVL